MEQPTYEISNWDHYFENAASRKVVRPAWVPIPNRHDGGRYRRLISMPNGEAIYGVWCLLVQLASRCPKRGVLSDEHGPFDAESIASKTGAKPELITDAIAVLSDDKIGWVVARYQHATSTLPERSSALAQDGREWNGKEKNPPTPQGGGDAVEAELQLRREAFVSQTWNIGDGRRLKVLAERFRELGTNSEEILARRKRMVAMWPKADTPESLLKHWGKFDGAELTLGSEYHRAMKKQADDFLAEQAKMRAEFVKRKVER